MSPSQSLQCYKCTLRGTRTLNKDVAFISLCLVWNPSSPAADGLLTSHLLILIAEHHPDDADSHAERWQQQHAHLWPFVQVRQVVLRDPADESGARINKQQQGVQLRRLLHLRRVGRGAVDTSHLHLQKGRRLTNGHRQLWRPTEEATQKMAMTQMAAQRETDRKSGFQGVTWSCLRCRLNDTSGQREWGTTELIYLASFSSS